MRRLRSTQWLLRVLLVGAPGAAVLHAQQPPPPPPPAAAAAPDAGPAAAPAPATTPAAAPAADAGPAAPAAQATAASTEPGCQEAAAGGSTGALATTDQAQKTRVDGPPPSRMPALRLYKPPPHWGGELTALTPEEAAEYEATVEEFAQGAVDFRAEISDLVQAQYRERRARLKDDYELRIIALEKEETRRRVAAIERFEKFVAKYPRDPTFTPDAVFRLAELHFELATDEYNTALRKYDEDVQAFERGDIKVEPVQPDHHYERTIALYQRMITEFPDHRLIDGAYYLLGYCLNEQGEEDQGIVQFLELVRRFPRSRYYSESWMRIGEHYFDDDKLPESIAAYLRVLEDRNSNYFDKALYKLGWAHYRLNQYDDAIARFMEVMDFSTQKKAEVGGEGSDLETESLQYIAVSLSDEMWDRGIGYTGEDDETGEKMVNFAVEYFKRGASRPYEREVFIRLADILFDASKYVGGVAGYRYALSLQPLAPDAPGLLDKIIQSWERARDFTQSSAVRDELVKNYTECTPWYTANKDNIEAIRTAQNLARSSLYSSAIFHHQQAQKYMSQDKYDLAKIENEQAAKGYGAYLKRFPHDKTAYELHYYLADTLYNSLQFREAANEYAWLRDTKQGTKYRAEAAANVYFALVKLKELEEQAGRLPVKKPFSGKDVETLPPQEEIPPLQKEIIDACDKFVEQLPNDEKVHAVKATAAEAYYAYGHFDEARPRLEEVIEKFPETDSAKISAAYIMNYLLTKKSWEEVEKFAQYVQSRKVGDQDEYRTLELGALFQKAKLYMDEGESLLSQSKVAEGNKRLEEAAAEYTRLVEQNKDHQFADKALFNAAVAYVKSNRFESALKMYERVYLEYPQSDLASEALWRVADNAYKSYEFQKAIDSYFLLIKKYPKSPNRVDAQYNAASLLENLQQYDKAAKEYENYAKMFPDREDAAQVFYRSVTIQEKKGDNKGLVAAINRFLQKYRKDDKQTDNVVDSLARLGDLAWDKGDQKEAEKQYKATLAEFASRKASTNSVAALHAARARFRLAEYALKKYEKLKIQGKSQQQLKDLNAKATELKKMEKEYQDVLPFKQLEWSLASAYRLGYLYENLAESILAAPCPPDVKRVGGQEACDEYRILLEDKMAAPFEEKAVSAYALGIKQAQESKFQNEWTRRALESAHKYRKDEYPVDKEPRRRFLAEQNVGMDVLAPAGAAEQKQLKGK